MKRTEEPMLELLVTEHPERDPDRDYWTRRLREAVVRSVDDPDWEPVDPPWERTDDVMAR